MKTKSTYNSRITTADEQRLYSHLLDCVSVESPDAMIDRFQALFLDGFGYPDREVVAALDRLLSCHEIDEYFRFILNRCCHILINRWQTNTQLQPAIPVLIALLESTPPSRVPELSRSRSVRRLRHVTHNFRDTEQYLALKRLARIIEARHSALPRYRQAEAVPLGSLINRYPYLYEHCLVTEDSDLQHQQYVRNMQVEAQHKFEVDLSHYVTYRVRQGRMHRQGRDDVAEKLRVVPNPTLLSDHDLASSLRHFARRRDHGQSYRDGAQRFLLTHDQGASFRQFKEDLFDYIMADVNVGYGQRQFKTMLQDHLLATCNDSDSSPVDDFLKVRTCSNLFNFLVVDPSAGRQHYVFLDLINNLGPVHTTGLLLRILLICQKVRPFVERRFSLLFNHYETVSSETVEWLVTMFENINIALSLNFGSVDLSHTTAR
ncbi:hypothetical protein IQ254_08610 [Nodosilinea sp. LEGE 07088]|uniref:hypothetical protein n=1 Tax=Nodosilinea sp. LEGE 07088 TaxID=2777968 RepID=UPI00187F7895|nr:hypothetical protein [Nodosilinea sp. LEGE 07088]MBE9137267.1 hypothetical protein [Nodosilinea sp. LEGE 07088]